MLHIYGLFNDVSRHLLYIGISKDPKARFRQHRYTTIAHIKKSCYMEVFESGESLTVEDEAFWINYMSSLGCNLINKTGKTGKVGKNPGVTMRKLRAEMEKLGLRPETVAYKTRLSIRTVLNARDGKPLSHSSATLIAQKLKIGIGELI